MSSTILTKREAKEFSKAHEFPTVSMYDIKRIEINSFAAHAFLGDKLRLALIEDMNDTESVDKYDPDADYLEDDEVVHTDGKVYIATKDAPSGEPACSADWELMDKFSTACFNELWCDYGLGEYLSVKLLLRSFPNSAMKLTGAGLVQDKGKDYEHVEGEDRGWWINLKKQQMKDCLRDVEAYIKDNEECFEDYVEETSGCAYEEDTVNRIRTGTWNFA